MIIKSISLTNFRNHASYHLECTDDTSLILGSNGWGKTSILEAIYILTRGKSFRATDPEIVRRDTTSYFIKLEYQTGTTVTAGYDGKVKIFHIEDKKTKRLPAKSKYPVVLFLPSDLNLISHAPSRRRDYFDNIFSILDEEYSTALSKYKKALRQRSELLKNPAVSESMVFSWNLLLARYGSFLSRARTHFLQEINSLLTPTYHSIADNADFIDIEYKSIVSTPPSSSARPYNSPLTSGQSGVASITTEQTPSFPKTRTATGPSNHSIVSSPALSTPPAITEQAYLSALERSFERDRYLGHTSFGVHHDDYLFNFNSRPAATSASRGETRSIILSLKFIEAQLYQSHLHKSPLILLDDVFSELDPSRRHCLIQNFTNHQVIITSVENNLE